MTLRLRIAELRFALDAPQANASAEFHQRRGWLVGLEHDGVLLGIGEASPLPGYSSETFVDAYVALRGVDGGMLLALESACLAGRFDEACGLTASMPASARFGVETAMLDAIARHAERREPLHRLLGAASRPSLRPAMLVHADDPRDAGTIAAQAARVGASAVKLKIGRVLGRERALARALREALGPDVELRFDANRSLDRSTGAELVQELATLAPCLLEEPYRDDAFLLGRDVDAGLPIALDESLRDLPAATLEHLLARGAVVALVLKPTTLGLFGCHALAATARAHGARSIVSHSYEGVIGYAAAAELALALGEPAPGLDAQYLASSLARRRLAGRNAETGELMRHDAPGIGVALDPYVGLPWS